MREKALLRSADDIASSPDGVQQGLVEALVDLATQPADVRLDDVGLGIEMEIPDFLQQHRARHDLARMPHQVLEDLELLGQELDALAGARHATRQKIDVQVANSQVRRLDDRWTAGEG